MFVWVRIWVLEHIFCDKFWFTTNMECYKKWCSQLKPILWHTHCKLNKTQKIWVYWGLCTKHGFLVTERVNFKSLPIFSFTILIKHRPKGTSHMLEKGTLSTRGRVNPSSLIKPNFTRFGKGLLTVSNWHHNMNASASKLAWYGFPISSLPPNTSLPPVFNHCLKTSSQIP